MAGISQGGLMIPNQWYAVLESVEGPAGKAYIPTEERTHALRSG
jgi:hypothetical protein